MEISMSMESAEIFKLKGKVACVTGASSGLGRQAALLLSRNGVHVVGVARNKNLLESWSLESGDNTAYLVCDLSKKEKIWEAANQVSEIFGPPDILINAAGVNTREHANDVSFKNWDKTIDLNLAAPFFLSQAFVPSMVKKGWGRVVNFASLQSRRAFPSGLSYGASKGGVEQMTRAMAEAWSSGGVNINAIAPGFFPTDLTEAVFKDPVLSKRNAEQTCIGRNGELNDLNGPILFLCSEASSYVTGQMIFVDGGFTAR
jgi:NAD(P)-dependent dehydrogenase (short-subunit alcohol dehydrogenase family)